MSILTPSLSKAARGLLDWHQSDLARHARVSLTAVTSFERKVGMTREKTLLTLKNAFEEHGIEFIAGGVRREDETANIMRYSGKDFITHLNKDIFAAVRKPRMEFLTCSTDDHLWPMYGKESHEEWKRFKTRMDLREKTIVPEGNVRFNSARSVYRILPPELIGKITYCIYADRMAYVLWRKMQVFTVRNITIADTMREQFKYLWRLGRSA